MRIDRREFLGKAMVGAGGVLAWAVGGCTRGRVEVLAPLPMHELSLGSAIRPAPALRPEPQPRPAPSRGPWYVEGTREWRHIVIHHSASPTGNAALFDQWHRKRGWDELGYHFVINNGRGGPDGRIEVGSRWRKQKWGAHTGGTPNNEYNNHGIGICLVGNYMTGLPTPVQLASLRRLVESLMAAYDIPRRNIIGHRDAPNTSTQCPGSALHTYLHRTFRPSLAAR